MRFIANDYEPGEVLKFIRQSANLTQKEFASLINKGRDWLSSCEVGRLNYFFKDLCLLCKLNNIDIIIKSKKK